MLLSFSVPEMRPMIEAGLRQRAGEDHIEYPRVKRQTIRARGTQWLRVLADSEGGNANGGKVNRDLHLWWKSRTKDRKHLGTVRGFEAWPIALEHRLHRHGAMCTASFPAATISAEIEPLPVRADNMSLYGFAALDGFDQWLDFVRFFVPKPGDRFVGVLIKW